jgi:hypothetical protein
MTTAAPPQAKVAKTSRRKLSAGAGVRLQPKCACGSQAAGLGGSCTECASKKKIGKWMQPKLRVNESGDAYEREADQVAEEMMGGASQPDVPRAAPGNEARVPVESELSHGGEPLSPALAKFYEPRFGRDFGAVRIHSGPTAAGYNNAVNSFAFTYGNHIWLGSPGLGRQPSHVLAHELAHVVQQTQPRALAAGVRGTAGRSAAPDRAACLTASPRSVQRWQPYWVPAEFIAGSPTASKAVGQKTHDIVLPKLGDLNSIYTEAPVPNADKNNGGYFDAKGIADLYRASTTVGVYFDDKGLPRELDSNSRLRYGGHRLVRNGHIDHSAPRAVESRRSVIRTANAPQDIEVGDLKPSHGTKEAEEGPQQVRNYLAGFKLAKDEVNKLEVGTGAFNQTDAPWTRLKSRPIMVKIPDEFKESTGGAGQASRALVQVQEGRVLHIPRRVGHEGHGFTQGKVYVTQSPGAGGIYNYVWEPDAPAAADLPGSVSDQGTEVDSKLIKPLMASPVEGKAMRRPTVPLRPPAIQRKSRDEPTPDAKDPFDKEALALWNANHTALTEKEQVLEKTPAFDDAKVKAAAIQDRQAAIKSGFNFRAPSDADTAAAKTVGRIQFWTGLSSAIFGRLRYWFGGLFVKVINAYHAIRARFRDLLGAKEGGTPKKGGLLGTVIRIAFEVLKAAGKFIVSSTAQELVTSLKTGVATKLKSLIPEDRLEEFESKVKQITDFASDLEQRALHTIEDFVKSTVGPYAGYIETIAKVADALSDIASIVDKVKWGAKFVACLSPPGWGCLWILAQSVLERFASWLIDTCWFKRDLAPLVTAQKFIKGLPKKLANFIIEGIRSFLPKSLEDVFAKIDVDSVSTDVPPDEVCDKDDFPPSLRDRALIEKLALQDLQNEIGEEKWQAWTKLADTYGVNRGEFLTEAEVKKLKEQLLRADVKAMHQAVELKDALSATTKGRDVVNLTTFLERAEDVKQQMAGGQGGQGAQSGQGGADEGVTLAASTSKTTGHFKPTGLRFVVTSGLTTGKYPGDIVTVDRTATIKGVTVTLEKVEARIVKRQLLPNASRPETIVVFMESTREQVFDVKEKYGQDVVNKISYDSFQIKKGSKFQHTLQLPSGAPVAPRR